MADFLPTTSSGVVTEKKSQGGYILVVEDDPDALQALAALLGLLGWQAITARDAATALVKARDYQPAILLLDINLPDMNGYVLATQVRSILPDARIIVASGEELDKVRAQEAGIDDSILKPVSLDQLQNILQ